MERMVEIERFDEEASYEVTLRPSSWDEYIGQEKIKKNLKVFIEASKKRDEALDHILFFGPPGLGKTTIANIIATEMNTNIKTTAAPMIEKAGDLAALLTNIEEGDILFIDEIHSLLDKQGGASSASSLLKPELARGEITIIGTTSVDNYTKFIESDEAFNRSFEIIKIEEPNEIVALRMLKKIIPNYETHHGLRVDPDVIEETIRLSKRYLKERALPDAAVDLLDRTMAAVKMVSVSSTDDLNALKEQFAELTANEKGLDEDELITELQWFNVYLRNKISEVLFTVIEDDKDVVKMETSKEIVSSIEEVLEKLKIRQADFIESLKVVSLNKKAMYSRYLSETKKSSSLFMISL